jgi:SAM-dependent methyltransferase
MNLVVRGVVRLQEDLSLIPILPGLSAWDYLSMCRTQHPQLYGLLDPGRVSREHTAKLFASIGELATHFESKLEKGRGDSYRQAQNSSFLIRSVGFLSLYDLAVPKHEHGTSQWAILDALGGNGTLTRIVRASRTGERLSYIVTSDVSARMIESALAQDLPAIRLPAQDLIWFRDHAFESVIIAYGTHHIQAQDRANALAEAYRVLKPGGRVVLQDFEIGSPTTRWYEKVLDQYTLTGHKYEYFTRQGFYDLLTTNCFVDVKVFDVYDPFILTANDPKEARIRLLDYVLTLFALEKLVPPDSVPNDRNWNELEAIVRDTSNFSPSQLPPGSSGVSEFTVSREGRQYRAEIPRVCLVATGRRPNASAHPESSGGSI